MILSLSKSFTNISFSCLLTPNAAPILNEVNRVLTLIIRFRCQLKTFSWILDATYTDASDASIQALRTTFEKYHIAVLSLFKGLSNEISRIVIEFILFSFIKISGEGLQNILSRSTDKIES